ncbi:MAG: ABC transporter permease, partial [Acetatifactor sp.]|nr:ABC transporter permease [Acetatifactor sp.]
ISLYGIDKAAVLELNETLDLEIDAEAFARGEFLIMEVFSPEQWQDIRQISGELVIGVTEKGRAFELPVGAVLPSGSLTGIAGEIQLFVSDSYLDSIADALQIWRIDLDFEQARDTDAFFILREIVRADNNIALLSRYELKQSVRETAAIMSVLGGSVSLIFGITGILNYINVMAVGVISRRRELAILESVGMERRQIGKMLLVEGIGYAVMSLASGSVLGNVIIAVLYGRIFEQTEFMYFRYPVIWFIIFFALILLICISAPLLVYRSINRATVSERLRQTE